MALSIALIIVIGLIFKLIFGKIKLPGLIGMLFAGILIGPYCLNLIDSSVLNISSDIRLIALIIILLRAGLGIRKEAIKSVGKPAILLSFVPNLCEGLTLTFASMIIFDFTFIQGGILGFIIAAVSPAVVVPSMLGFMEKNKGGNIPTMILTGASVDDVFSITIFTTFLGLYTGSNVNIAINILGIPISIFLGLLLGLGVGLFFVYIFKKFHIRDTIKVLLLISAGIFMNVTEHSLKNIIPIASLLGVMMIGYVFLQRKEDAAVRISKRMSKVWVFAEIFLFVLVAAEVNINVVFNSGLKGLLLILIGLIARSIGVYISLSGSKLSKGEKLFTVVAYMPKATVQAAIGGVPLAMGVLDGELILAIAVLSILVTAPLGAIGIKIIGEKYLK